MKKDQIKKYAGCCSNPQCKSNAGIWEFGANFTQSDFTGMTPALQAQLDDLDKRIQEFEASLGGAEVC